MRWLGVVVIAACGGTSSAREPIASSVPPPAICEDTIMAAPEFSGAGLVISEGTLLERAIRAHNPSLRACYTQRLKDRPHLGGKVVIDIIVATDGRPRRIHTKGFDAELDRCLCETLSALQIGTLAGGELKASYPLMFTPPRW